MTADLTTPPIDLAPRQRRLRPVRRAAAWLHLALALAIVAGVLAQVYLIGAYVFGAGQGALDAHRSLGFAVHGLEVLTLLAALIAWLPRADRWLSFVLAALGTVQIALAGAHAWTGGLHPLGAMIVLALAAALAQRGLRRRRPT